MLVDIQFDRLLFLDIETVPACRNFEELDSEWQELWDKKSKYTREKEGIGLAESYSRASLHAEFGRIVCISVGYLATTTDGKRIYLKSYFGHDEKRLLEEFAALLDNEPNKNLCAHNGKGFDFPFISRRMLSHNINLPNALRTHGKKPWEIQHLDTMELWKFGAWKSSVSLALLAKLFGVPSPKDDIDGSMVGHVYHEEKDLDRIVRYCEKDVVGLIQVFLRMNGETVVLDSDIHRR